jgi:hypothetical protein
MRRTEGNLKVVTEPRISVPGDPSVLKKLRMEKAETGLSFIEIVNTRLAKSYADMPRFPYESVSA